MKECSEDGMTRHEQIREFANNLERLPREQARLLCPPSVVIEDAFVNPLALDAISRGDGSRKHVFAHLGIDNSGAPDVPVCEDGECQDTFLALKNTIKGY